MRHDEELRVETTRQSRARMRAAEQIRKQEQEQEERNQKFKLEAVLSCMRRRIRVIQYEAGSGCYRV